MYIITLLLLYIILSHKYFYKIWNDLFRIYKELQNKYGSKQRVSGIIPDFKPWVNGINTELITRIVCGYFATKNNPTRYTKHK